MGEVKISLIQLGGIVSQLTFTTEEVKEAAKWLDFVHKNATWGNNITSAQAQEVGRFFNWCHKHVKMMNDHILELVEHVPAPSATEKAPKKAKV